VCRSTRDAGRAYRRPKKQRSPSFIVTRSTSPDNLRPAALGLTIPETLLATADEVIQ
jgi:hypothetical protein